jgi:hypothetical protein
MAGITTLRESENLQKTRCCDKQDIKQLVLQSAIAVSACAFVFSGLATIGLAFSAISIVPVSMCIAKKCGMSYKTIDKINLLIGSIGLLGATALAVTGALTVSVPVLIAGFALGVISIISAIETSNK